MSPTDSRSKEGRHVSDGQWIQHQRGDRADQGRPHHSGRDVGDAHQSQPERWYDVGAQPGSGHDLQDQRGQPTQGSRPGGCQEGAHGDRRVLRSYPQVVHRIRREGEDLPQHLMDRCPVMECNISMCRAPLLSI